MDSVASTLIEIVWSDAIVLNNTKLTLRKCSKAQKSRRERERERERERD
jgi:hypothetical protein